MWVRLPLNMQSCCPASQVLGLQVYTVYTGSNMGSHDNAFTKFLYEDFSVSSGALKKVSEVGV